MVYYTAKMIKLKSTVRTNIKDDRPGAAVLPYAICILLLICQLFSGACQPAFAQTSKEQEAFFVARKAFEDGFYDVSLSLLERFLQNYPTSSYTAQANLLIGQCYYHQSKFLDALGKFEQLLSSPLAKDIRDAVLYWTAEVHFKGNAFSKAAQYYREIIEGFPNSSYGPAAHYSLAWCYFQDERFDEALKYFRAVEEKFPTDPQAQDSSYKIVECLYNLRDYDGLKEKADFYLKAYPKDTGRSASLHYYTAEAQYYLNDLEDAIKSYMKAISSTDDVRLEAIAYLGIGWSRLKLQQYKEAQQVFAQINSVNLDKKSSDILFLGKAILEFETKAFTQAKNTYSELMSSTQDSSVLMQASLGMADCLYNLAEYKEAIAVYAKALKELPGLKDVPQEIIDKLHYGLAWAYLKEGEFKEAIEEFQKLVKQTGDKIFKISTLCQIGDTYQDSGDYNKAVATYDSILRDYPDSLYSDYVQYQLGITLLKIYNYDGAIMAFQTLKKNFPASKLLDDATYSLGLAYFQREDYVSSKETFEKFRTEFNESSLKAQATYLLGSSLYNLGRFAEAIEVFKDIARGFSNDIELVQKAEYEIADCYYQMGDENEAMARFKALRTKYPDSSLTAEVMWWLGEYYYRRKEFDLARRYFSSLIKDYPGSTLVASSYYALGSIAMEEAQPSKAIDNFKKVMELDDSDLSGTAAIAIADIYVQEENFDSATATYEDVLRKYANLAHLIYPKIAEIYRRKNEYDKAIAMLEKSLEVVPVRQMADIQFKIAETRQAQGRISDAIEEYLRVTYLYSSSQELTVKSLLRVAAIYEDQDNFREALAIYKKITSLDAEEAKYAQERIEWIKANVK